MRIRLDNPLFLNEISDEAIEYISTDTRELRAGDLFIPLVGKSFDGRKFIKDAESIGARVYETDDGERALLNIANLYKSSLKSLKYTVAITGSVGKTTTKEFLYEILKYSYKVHKTSENENNAVGVSKTLLSAPRDTEVLILEVGTNHTGEIARITDIIQPTHALITNIGTSHIGNFGSREGIKKEKTCIVGNGNATSFTRYEDEISLVGSARFSVKTREADFFLEKTPNGISFYKKSERLLDSVCKMSEEHLLELLCAAVGISLDLGASKESVIRGISSISYNNTRQNIFSVGKFHIFSDCYNASYESFLADFKALLAMEQYKERSLVLGDIGELGEYSEAIHYELGKQISKYGFRRVYIVGAMRATVISGILSGGGRAPKITTFSESYTPRFIAGVILENAAEGEIILFKASRKMKLEKIIDEINERCFN